MNWLMWEKMFSYFYNKFMPVNRMHYIKCAVNSSLLTLFWLLQKVCGTLDPCFIMTHSIHKEGVYKFTLVWYSTKQGTLNRPTSHLVHLCTVPLLWLWQTEMAVHLGWWFRWPLFVMVTLKYQNSFCSHTWSYSQSVGGVILALSSFLSLIPHQKEPEISVSIFSPTWR